VTAAAFEAISPDLPAHDAELMTSHEGQPTVEVQARTHGAGMPAEDLGVPDDTKYGSIY
jgi:hypothetical protein